MLTKVLLFLDVGGCLDLFEGESEAPEVLRKEQEKIREAGYEPVLHLFTSGSPSSTAKFLKSRGLQVGDGIISGACAYNSMGVYGLVEPDGFFKPIREDKNIIPTILQRHGIEFKDPFIIDDSSESGLQKLAIGRPMEEISDPEKTEAARRVIVINPRFVSKSNPDWKRLVWEDALARTVISIKELVPAESSVDEIPRTLAKPPEALDLSPRTDFSATRGGHS